MTLIFVLLALVGVITIASAEPKVVQLDFERRPPASSSSMKLRRRAASVTADVYDAQSDLLYLVNVTVGTPPQSLQLQLDTGSSDIWVPWSQSPSCTSRAQRCKEGTYNSGSSSTYELLAKNSFIISYVDNTKIAGDYIQDTFTIGPATIQKMIMGLAKSASESDPGSDFEGIVGVGFEHGEAYYAQTGKSYPNLVSQLVSSGQIHTRAYSLYLNDRANGIGSVLFGGVDTKKYSGDLVSLPIQPDGRTGTIVSFTVALDGFKVNDAAGGTPYDRNNLAAPVIFDSGTTITYLPDDIANRLYQGVGAVNSALYGWVCPCDVGSSTATLEFRFGNANGPRIVTPLSQFVLPFPSDMQPPTFRGSGKVGCRWGIQGSQGKPNLFGDTFLRGAYVVYNLENHEVAIAKANLNSSSSNIVEITKKNIPGVTSTASGSVTSNTADTSAILGPHTHFLGLHGSRTSQISVEPTGSTFNLGATKTSTSTATPNSHGKKSSGSEKSQSPPLISVLFFMTVMISACLGGSVVLFMAI